MPSANEWYHLQLVESRVNEYGILSLTRNPVSFDMWSKYANGHKGFLIELKPDFNKHKCLCSDIGVSYDISPITYVETFEIPLRECEDTKGLLSLEDFDRRFFFTKVNRWESEKEFRLVRPLKDIGKLPGRLHIGTYRDFETVYLGDLPLELISTITFGAYMPRETKRWIIKKCAGTGIQFLQSIIYPKERDEHDRTPKVRLLVLDDPATRAKVLDMHPQLLLMANIEMLPSKLVPLSQLSDLPYYSFNSTFVQGTFDRLKQRAKSKLS